ncbi:alpha-glucosidase C-terminal domain-containing protein [Flavobacterium sp. J49]|uniref:alpha-amylase family glycosyl hydrolase n=1 Tax=Flavobacterium sp. J49 TaxID=2718534 RepID=UPI001594A089|nr:alpha-amylase family glycosyl hydrolase [Flavobacterium sp. J49]MBF6640684.1 alpha-glucosidase C-terminal domain-containing protein [Flavobacterium sp. J49]NIC01931.1 alpha-amylase [Flavobacterium sp. J49]
MKSISKILFLALGLLSVSCMKEKNGETSDSRYQPKEFVEVKHPEWSKNATIYEANIRQFTPEGTFKAFEAHLPRIKAMGIDIIWLMPIHPIGVEKRKGTLGSEYSVKDYYGVNPEFGTKEDFKHLVDKIHSMGMHIIIDWVANHSSWDNQLVKDHPDWYTKTEEGNFQPTPWYDWDDVIDFDYDKPELRKYMTEALVYWVKDFDIDGYRCDTAGFIPTDFWDNARAEMDAVKPVFMLGEWESRDLHKKAFDMTYSWTLFDKMVAVTRDKKSIAGLVEYMAHDVSTFPRDGYRMLFTDNHDMNSWNNNMEYNFGDGLEASIVLTGTINGMPLVYGGQEAGLNRSLKFFDKDLIDWSKMPYEGLFKKLFALKHRNPALWNGNEGGVMVRLYNDKMEQVISFSRTKDKNRVIPIINYSDKPVTVKLNSKYLKGDYTEVFSGKKTALKGDDILTLKPWEYAVLEK